MLVSSDFAGYFVLCSASEETQQVVTISKSPCLLDPEPERMSLGLTEGTKFNCALGLIWAGSYFVSWMTEELVMMAAFIDIELKTW